MMERAPAPKVSVIVPVYNRENYLGKCIDSILAQEYRDYEILLVDNNSANGSVRVIREYEKFYPHKIRCLSQPKQGAAAARNLGACAARGAYLAFLDSDDLWFPEKLKIQMFFFEKKKDVDLMYTSYARFGKNGLMRGDELRKLYPRLLDGHILPDLLLECFIWTSTVVIRKSVFRELGGFDESLATGEDYDLWLRAAVKYKIFGIPLALAQYRQHDENLMKSDLLSATNPSEVEVVKKFVREYSDIRKTVPLRAWRRRISIPFFNNAYTAFHRGDMTLARRFVLKALAEYPFSLTYFRYFFLSLMPGPLLKTLMRMLRKGMIDE
ncbi:MAG: glycosyltransferase [Candidatus Omnitrophota bacterium]